MRRVTIETIAYQPKPRSSEYLSAIETRFVMGMVRYLGNDKLSRPFNICVQPSPIAGAIGSLASAILLQDPCEPFAIPSLDTISVGDYQTLSITQALQIIAAKTEESGNDLCLMVGDKFCMDTFLKHPCQQIGDTEFTFNKCNYLL